MRLQLILLRVEHTDINVPSVVVPKNWTPA
jgi:hypothetical protein